MFMVVLILLGFLYLGCELLWLVGTCVGVWWLPDCQFCGFVAGCGFGLRLVGFLGYLWFSGLWCFGCIDCFPVVSFLVRVCII